MERGLDKAVSKIDRFLFGPGAENNPRKQDVAITPPESKIAALSELRQRLAGDVTRFRTFIEEAKVEDNKTRSGWSKVVHQIDRFISEDSQTIAKRRWGSEITKSLKVIEAINQGDDHVARNYLVDEIEEAIKMARRGLLITEDRESEHVWIDGAQQNIDILIRIDPEQGEKLQEELDRKTGNPLTKF